MKKSQDLVLDRLRYLRTLVEAGFTFHEALRRAGPPGVVVTFDFARRWDSLRREIEKGESSTLAALDAFLDQMTLEKEVENLIRKSSALPRLQGLLATSLFLLIFIARLCYFGFHFFAADAVAFLLLVLGLGVFRWLLKRAQRGQWVLSWLTLLGHLEGKVRSGKTLQQAFHESREGPWLSDLPPGLAELWRDPQKNRKSSVDSFEREACESLALLRDAAAQGVSLAPLLQSLRKNFKFAYEREAEARSLRLSFSCLVPLYLLIFPAALLALLNPIFAVLLY